jgi:hypothetical protein
MNRVSIGEDDDTSNRSLVYINVTIFVGTLLIGEFIH